VLLQAAAFNLALILRSITKAGTPKGLADLKTKLLCALWRVLAALPPLYAPTTSSVAALSPISLEKHCSFANLRSSSSRFSLCRNWSF
jgi:hypothetical protein